MSSAARSDRRVSGGGFILANARGGTIASRMNARISGGRGSNITGRALVDPHKFDPLLIEDPLMRSNNIGRNCFRIYYIQRTCANAHAALLEARQC